MERSRPGEGHADLSALPGLAPSTADEASAGRMIEVDGERSELGADEFGGTHDDWLSGPHAGYGFAASPTLEWSDDDHRGCIRSFLAQIDPETGFVGDD